MLRRLHLHLIALVVNFNLATRCSAATTILCSYTAHNRRSSSSKSCFSKDVMRRLVLKTSSSIPCSALLTLVQDSRTYQLLARPLLYGLKPRKWPEPLESQDDKLQPKKFSNPPGCRVATTTGRIINNMPLLAGYLNLSKRHALYRLLQTSPAANILQE